MGLSLRLELMEEGGGGGAGRFGAGRFGCALIFEDAIWFWNQLVGERREDEPMVVDLTVSYRLCRDAGRDEYSKTLWDVEGAGVAARIRRSDTALATKSAKAFKIT